MANIDISAEIAAISSAIYGEEVRGSIKTALTKMVTAINTAIGHQVIDEESVEELLASEALSLKYSTYTELTEGTDLNAYAGTANNYWIPYAKAQTLNNMPVPRAGRLFVFPAKGSGTNDDGGVQIFMTSQVSGKVQVYMRGWKGTTWSSWQMIGGAAEGLVSEYNNNQMYSVGDYVQYDHIIYKCVSAIVNPEAWDANHWTVATLCDEITDLKGTLKTLNSMDIFPLCSYRSSTVKGIKAKYSSGVISFIGTLTGSAPAFIPFYHDSSVVPSFIETGKDYYLKMKKVGGSTNFMECSVGYYINGTSYSDGYTSDRVIHIPSTATGFTLRFKTSNMSVGDSIHEAYQIALYTVESNADLSCDITRLSGAYVSTDSTNLYFELATDGFYFRLNAMYLHHPRLNGTVRVAMSETSETTRTSPKGYTSCYFLPKSYVLRYNIDTGAFGIIDGSEVTKSDLEIFRAGTAYYENNAYVIGVVGGLGLPFFNSWFYKSYSSTSQKLYDNLEVGNAINVFNFAKLSNATSNGLKWNVNSDDSITVTGTSTAASMYSIWYDSSSLPSWIEKGKEYYLSFSGIDVSIAINYYTSEWITLVASQKTGASFTIPNTDNVRGLAIRMSVPNGVTINETVKPMLFNAMPSANASSKIAAIKEDAIRTVTLQGVSKNIGSTADWEQGGLSYVTGGNTSSTNRCRYKRLITFSDARCVSVSIASGLKLCVREYWAASKAQYKGTPLDFFTGSATFKAIPGNFYCFVLGKIDDVIFSPDEITENAVTLTTHAVKDTLPDYWQAYMETKIPELQAMDADHGHSSSFVFITDVHWETNRRQSPALIKEIQNKTSVKRVICGGDLINYASDRAYAIELMNDFLNSVECMGTICGNHDDNGESTQVVGPEKLDASARYGVITKKSQTFIDATDTYYVWKDESAKVAYITLDTTDYKVTTTQQTWLNSQIQSLYSNYHIVIVTHIYYNGYDATTGQLIYHNETAGVIDSVIGNLNSTVRNKIVCIITGHTHRDFIYRNEYGIPVIVTKCDAYAKDHDEGALDMIPGTVTEQAFDVCYIDISAQMIYLKRVGSGVNRSISFRP